MQYEILVDGVVVNTIVASEEFAKDYCQKLGAEYRLIPQLASQQEKEQRIAQSKADLAAYLEAHPLAWTDGETYSITAEKQAQLTGKIMAATMAQTMDADYTLTWNSTGEVCKEWTLQDLSALAFAIDARVTALVSYQQKQEVAMRNAVTMDELNAVVVDYDTVQ